MICPHCGSTVSDLKEFCINCGAPLRGGAPEALPARPHEPAPQYPPQAHSGNPQVPPQYKPISMWGYFGYEILFAIPLIGLILLLVFSFGGTTNVNLRNFARSYFCLFLVVLMITGLMILFFGSGALLSLLRIR